MRYKEQIIGMQVKMIIGYFAPLLVRKKYILKVSLA